MSHILGILSVERLHQREICLIYNRLVLATDNKKLCERLDVLFASFVMRSLSDDSVAVMY